eukprot:764437-Hanusia_phi.AAC.1
MKRGREGREEGGDEGREELEVIESGPSCADERRGLPLRRHVMSLRLLADSKQTVRRDETAAASAGEGESPDHILLAIISAYPLITLSESLLFLSDPPDDGDERKKVFVFYTTPPPPPLPPQLSRRPANLTIDRGDIDTPLDSPIQVAPVLLLFPT